MTTTATQIPTFSANVLDLLTSGEYRYLTVDTVQSVFGPCEDEAYEALEALVDEGVLDTRRGEIGSVERHYVLAVA